MEKVLGDADISHLAQGLFWRSLNGPVWKSSITGAESSPKSSLYIKRRRSSAFTAKKAASASPTSVRLLFALECFYPSLNKWSFNSMFVLLCDEIDLSQISDDGHMFHDHAEFDRDSCGGV